ncbi:CBN-NHR-5 protein [Aphelenchoides avenae]|nr:CBN-NHR-5 protein [Aphelenchus avenae]
MSCLGCKGFFRRALKRATQYECQFGNKCVIDKHERNSCRACRFQKCIDVGMDPGAVRPDRDQTGKQKANRELPQRRDSMSGQAGGDRASRIEMEPEDWTKKLPVEMRTLMLKMLNIEAKVNLGDTRKNANELYPLQVATIREIIENPSVLKGKRTEMRYEPYRMARNEEFRAVVYRHLIAAVDWVEFLCEMMGGLSVEDRIILVKAIFGPLMIFRSSVKTALITERNDVLCLCNFNYVPRDISKSYSDTFHLDNTIVDRVLDHLVTPYRRIQLRPEEVACLTAITCLNPMAKDLSEAGSEKVLELISRLQDLLFLIVKESRPGVIPSSFYGNFLLFLPTITGLAHAATENLRFALTFSKLGGIPVLTSLFGCFPVEPFVDSKFSANSTRQQVIMKHAEVQTDAPPSSPRTEQQERSRKRRLPTSFTSPVENEAPYMFRLLQPPCTYTLAEMFDDRMHEGASGTGTPTNEYTPVATSSNFTWPATHTSTQTQQQPQPQYYAQEWHTPAATTNVPNHAGHMPLASSASYPSYSNGPHNMFPPTCAPHQTGAYDYNNAYAQPQMYNNCQPQQAQQPQQSFVQNSMYADDSMPYSFSLESLSFEYT